MKNKIQNFKSIPLTQSVCIIYKHFTKIYGINKKEVKNNRGAAAAENRGKYVFGEPTKLKIKKGTQTGGKSRKGRKVIKTKRVTKAKLRKTCKKSNRKQRKTHKKRC